MAEVVVFSGPRQVAIEHAEDGEAGAQQVRLKTLYSGISAGTELTQYRGTNPYLHKEWDSTQRLFRTGAGSSLVYPIRTLGYEEVGEVVEVGPGVDDIPVGSYVFGTWGHRSQHIAGADYVRPRLLPAGLEPILGIFSHLGAIALNGVHDAQIRVGETVAVFGLGALGQIVAQLARASGARVIAVDLLDERLALARQLGAHETLNPAREPVAEAVKAATGGRGADVCLEVTGVTAALHEAVRAAAYSARVVAMGFFQGEATGLYLGEEFHHNRINLVCSQISGTSPELSYRWDRLRLWQTAIRLQAEGLLNLRPLISHVAPFAAAATLYALLDTQPEAVMQAVLDFTA
ncbi:MAG: zinc-binding alcohol dehydrogenase [Anaerolineae bacterium]|nr:zinc-binding alcohol dehydrogenase [Anaerolineae bacterium]